MVRRTAMAGITIVAVLAACGGGGDGDDGGEARTSGAGDEAASEAAASEAAAGGDFCGDLEALVSAGTEIMTPIYEEDLAGLQDVMTDVATSYPGLVEAAVASAPADRAGDVTVVTDWTMGVLGALGEADLADPVSITTALEDTPMSDPELAAASDRLSEYARAECGFDPDGASGGTDGGEQAGAGEPPDPCSFVDPQVPAAAAGITVDNPEADVTGDMDLGSYAMKGCAYDRGEMTVTTVTYAGTADEVLQDWIDTTENNGGTATTDFDHGRLGEATVIMSTNGYTTIAVFDTPAPFSLGFSDVADPATLVAAAEAVVTATS